MGWLPCKQDYSWLFKVTETRGMSLQSRPHGFSGTITVKYNVKGRTPLAGDPWA